MYIYIYMCIYMYMCASNSFFDFFLHVILEKHRHLHFNHQTHPGLTLGASNSRPAGIWQLCQASVPLTFQWNAPKATKPRNSVAMLRICWRPCDSFKLEPIGPIRPVNAQRKSILAGNGQSSISIRPSSARHPSENNPHIWYYKYIYIYSLFYDTLNWYMLWRFSIGDFFETT